MTIRDDAGQDLRSKRPPPSSPRPVPGFENGQNPEAPVEIKTVVKPVQNAIAILRHLHDVGKPATATQISRALRINTSTCFNILRTLVSEGVVSFDVTVKTYKIGLGLLRLASNVDSEENRLAAARPYLQAYAGKHHATLCLWRRVSQDRNVLVAVEYSRNNVRIYLQLGQTLPVLLGSTGRIMATHLGMTKTQVRAEVRKLRWFEAPDFEDFWREAKEAEERGWAVDNGNFSAGVLTISAPIYNAIGSISYSVTALTFREQHRDKPIEMLGESLVALATELQTILY